MKNPKQVFGDRVVWLKQRRPELAEKDLTRSENLDIDAFESLFPRPPLPAEGAADFMAKLLQEERRRVLQAVAALSDEERERLQSSGQYFGLID